MAKMWTWLGMALMAVAAGACGSDGPVEPQPVVEPDPDPDPDPQAGGVEIMRDVRGVPHIYGETRAAAFYGLGWASASDRLYQMDYARRFMRGRMAETFAGESPAVDAKLIDHDRRMRVLGFHRNADRILANPDFPADIREAIDAYVEGVNDYVASEDFSLPPAFAEAGIDSFEPWTAADSLLAWERIRERFNADPIDGEIAQLQQCQSAAGCFDAPCVAPIDEAAAVVPEAETWPPAGATAFFREDGASFQPAPKAGQAIEFKASHGWAVHGSRTTTGKPVLAMDPKLALTAPSMWYAFHLSWPGTQSAGLGVAGAPAYLIFWNEHVSQTLTAGGGDIADLFELQPSDDGEGYIVDGEVHSYDTFQETIAIKGRDPLELEVKESLFGPVVTPLIEMGGRAFALRHIDLMHQDTHSLVGAINIISATDLDSYLAAFDDWLTPGANTVFATNDGEHGHIGYIVAGAIGKRAANIHEGVDLGGRHPHDGSTAANDWSGYLSVYERPHVIDPEQGYVFSANHLPVGSWFDDYAYTGAKNVGDTLRSLRLRYMFKELLDGNDDAKLSPDDVHAMHFDAEQDAVRLFGDMLQYLADAGTIPSIAGDVPAATAMEKAAKVLLALDRFEAEGAELRYSNPIYPVADRIVGETPFEMRYLKNPDIFCLYNSAEGGYSFFVKSFDADPDGTMANPVVVDFVINEAARIWDAVIADGADQDPAAWQAPATTPEYTVMYQANQFCHSSTAGNCSLDPSKDFGVPLDSAAVHSIQSSLGSSGTATIDLADVDASLQLVPLGVSEDPTSDYFKSGLEAWISSDNGAPATPPAPLSKELVAEAAVSTLALEYGE